jgi:hypothetical protein
MAGSIPPAGPARRSLDLTPGGTNLFVFSHPNHELAVFGLLQRLRPRLLYLTDGGGEARVQQTRDGLDRIGLAERAHFLNYTEQACYDALLARDVAFFEAIADRVRARHGDVEPRQVFCDAVEFYNPLHDLTLPIVTAALADTAAAIFEVPLVHQQPGPRETYAVQRMPPSRRDGQSEVRLAAEELAVKLAARADGYSMLQAQMGPVLSGLPDTHLTNEIVAPAPTELPVPPADCVLRYEWRAQRLLDRGEIERAITYAEHYRPVASALFRSS